MADRCLNQGRPFLQLVVGGGCLDLVPDSWNAPRHIFPLTSTKLPLYLAGGDDGDSDEGDRQRHRQRQRLSSAPETSSETSVGGLEILPIEIFLLREKSFHLSISTYYCTLPYLTPLFLFWGWGFLLPIFPSLPLSRGN